MSGKAAVSNALRLRTNLVVVRKFGIVYEVPERVNKAMQGFGLDPKDYYYSLKAELPLSATNVIDKTGKVAYAFFDPDYENRAEPSEVMRVLSRLKQ